MERRQPLAQWLCMLLIATFLLGSVYMPVAQAGMIGTGEYLQQQRLEQQRSDLQALLEREEVRRQLWKMGVDPQEAQARVDALSDAEVTELAARMDELPAGAGPLNALIFVFLVLLVTDILGVTDIFPFVRSPSADY